MTGIGGSGISNGMSVGGSYLKLLGQVPVKAIILNIAYFIF